MKYHKRDTIWFPSSDGKMDVHDVLPPGNYTVCKNPCGADYYFEEAEPFDLPAKIYGKTEQWSKRILTSFRAETHQTGVLLSGTKGSGKTLLAKHLAVSSGLPVLLVNQPFADDRFLQTIQAIQQPAVILFDEFEKVYDKDDQESVLTLFDGVYTATNKLMILTCNHRHAVQQHFHNRPGRLRYAIEFRGLDAAFIRAYCIDNLVDGAYVHDVLKLAWSCHEFNFDMLQAVVRELNTYGGTVVETVEILNVKQVETRNEEWWVTLTAPALPDLEVTTEADFEQHPIQWFSQNGGWPKQMSVRARGTLPDGITLDEEASNVVTFNLDALKTIDAQKSIYTFEVEGTLAVEQDRCVTLPLRITVKPAERKSTMELNWNLDWRDVS